MHGIGLDGNTAPNAGDIQPPLQVDQTPLPYGKQFISPLHAPHAEAQVVAKVPTTTTGSSLLLGMHTWGPVGGRGPMGRQQIIHL